MFSFLFCTHSTKLHLIVVNLLITRTTNLFFYLGNNVIEYDEYVNLLKDYVKDPQIVEIELREAFRVFDKDRNNNLNFVELRKALTSLGDPLTDKEAIELCKLMDVNGDNKVDVDGKKDSRIRFNLTSF